MAAYTDDELLAMLRSAMSAPPATPDDVTLGRLHTTLAGLPGAQGPTLSRARPRGFIALRRRVANHATAYLIAAVSILATGGVAAAAVATDNLPGPIRNIAYDIGLPVTSPIMFQTQQNLAQLGQLIKNGEHHRARRLGEQVVQDLKGLDPSELSQVRDTAKSLLSEAGVDLPEHSTLSPATVPTLTPLPSIPETTVPESTSSSSGDSTNSPSKNSSSGLGITIPLPTITTPSTDISGGDATSTDSNQTDQTTTTTTTTTTTIISGNEGN